MCGFGSGGSEGATPWVLRSKVLQDYRLLCDYYSLYHEKQIPLGKWTALGSVWALHHWEDVIKEAACCFIEVHGNVLKVPAGSRCIRLNLTPHFIGPRRPFASIDMALLSAGMWHVSSQMPLLNLQEAERRVPDCGHQKIRRAALNLTQSPSHSTSLMRPDGLLHAEKSL